MASKETSYFSKTISMNHNVHQLYEISQKKSRLIIGLMSGTSLDGLDIALCKINGEGVGTKVSLMAFETIPYTSYCKQMIQSVFSKDSIALQQLCLANEKLGQIHADMINAFLKRRKISSKKIDLIASHGQTVYHAPKKFHQNKLFGNGTLQIGDADQIAVGTGIITISDFRQKHIAAGGEGAPLAAYGDFLLFGHPKKNVILLNIGGISNATFIPAGGKWNKVVCTDIGPGNNLMDQWMQAHFPGKQFDQDGKMARKGTVHKGLLQALNRHPFFKIKFPKTTGPEWFNLSFIKKAQKESQTEKIIHEDLMATLNLFTAQTIAHAIQQIAGQHSPFDLLISGGGSENKLLIENLQLLLPKVAVQTTARKKIHPGAKEAILFALLANEQTAGTKKTFDKAPANMPNVGMGKISFPD